LLPILLLAVARLIGRILIALLLLTLLSALALTALGVWHGSPPSVRNADASAFDEEL
jgi:hypothetical protein